MKLVSFGPRGRERPGLVYQRWILDLPALDPSLPPTLREILAAGLIDRIRGIEKEAQKVPTRFRLPLSGQRLAPPVTDPTKVICLGLNYEDHAREQGKELPDWPLLFAKAPSCLIGDGDPIPIPPGVEKLDHEVELAFVVGRRAKDVPVDTAYDYIAGYAVFMDISARDVQFREKQWFRAKSFDGFGPFGPWLTTADEVKDPHNLSISLEVNGRKYQDSNTGRMRFKVDYLLHYLSHSMTLEPGDVVATGTPAGVGVFASPPRFLVRGDRLKASIASLGTLTNTVA